MRKVLAILILMLGLVSMAKAQELEVVSFGEVNDILTGDMLRKDLNGNYCALVKVLLPVEGAVFDGDIIGKVDYEVSEYFVYVVEGTKMLQVKCPGHYPLMLNFQDYGVNGVKAKRVYALKLKGQSSGGQHSDLGVNFVVLKVVPENCIVVIDNQPREVKSGGVVKATLPYGEHNYTVSANGYESQSGTFTITRDGTVNKTVQLKSTMAHVTITTQTPGAQIYVDGDYKASGRWDGTLPPGMYSVECRKDGYEPRSLVLNLAKSESRSVTIDALTPIFGSLTVDYEPVGAEVTVDGKDVGVTPLILNDLTVGKHTVVVKADGFETVTKTVDITQSQNTQLSGQLTKPALQERPLVSKDGMKTFDVNGVKFNMVFVKGGTFRMGATLEQYKGYGSFDNEIPAHTVTLSDYCIGETEVTQALWYAVMGASPSANKSWSSDKGLGDEYPAYYISYTECQTFIKKLNQMTGQNFRMPTEAEWEYAARGGNKSKGYIFSGSDNIDDVAWYRSNSEKRTHPVGQKAANELGIYDMSGNVYEWCSDWYGSYNSGSQTNPTGPATGSHRVDRGGGWYDRAIYCRVADRGKDSPGNRYSILGLRLVL